MPVHPKMPAELVSICNRWRQAMEKLKAEKERIEYIQDELPELLHKRDIFVELLGNIAKGQPYPDTRRAQLFEDEILLYLNTKPLFSIRMFIYEPGAHTPIHDHNSWGVIGSALGKIGVIKYRREDDGSEQGYARLHKSEDLILEGSQTDIALPLNQGIHQTGNPDSDTSIMVSVYGRPIRQVYIHRFDLENNRIIRMYPPRIKKRLLATQALDIMGAIPASAVPDKT
jgi:predicted metal-dependent enzyme (double-stranded beta helix superfamily)